MAINNRLDVVSDFGRHDASLDSAQSARWFSSQLISRALAMLSETIPTAWIDAVRVRAWTRH